MITGVVVFIVSFIRYTGIVFFYQVSGMIVFAAWMIGRCRGPPSRLIGTQNSLQIIKVANILQDYRGNQIFSSKNMKKQLTEFFIAWKRLIVCSQLAASPIFRTRKVSNFGKFSFKKTLKLSRSFENGAAADEWECHNHGWWEWECQNHGCWWMRMSKSWLARGGHKADIVGKRTEIGKVENGACLPNIN